MNTTTLGAGHISSAAAVQFGGKKTRALALGTLLAVATPFVAGAETAPAAAEPAVKTENPCWQPQKTAEEAKACWEKAEKQGWSIGYDKALMMMRELLARCKQGQ